MNKKNLAIVIGSLAVVCLIGVVAFNSNNSAVEDTSLSVDTNVSVDENTTPELEWVQLQKDNLPYEAEGNLYVPNTEDTVIIDEDLSNLTVDTLKEVLEVDTETGITTGITQGNNIVTIIPEKMTSHFDSDYSDIIDESNMTVNPDILAMMDIPKTTTEGFSEAQQAIENSTNGSELVWGSN